MNLHDSLKFVLGFTNTYRTFMAGIVSVLLVLIGILPLYCTQQGYLPEAYLLLMTKCVAAQFYNAQIEPTLHKIPLMMRFGRQVLMAATLEGIVFPATISFYFDLELFSPLNVIMLFFSVLHSLSIVFYAAIGVVNQESIFRYRLFGLIKYPITNEILLLPLFFHVYGWQYVHIEWYIGGIMIVLNVINCPAMPNLFGYCFSSKFTALVFQKEAFANQKQFGIYKIISNHINRLIRKIGKKSDE